MLSKNLNIEKRKTLYPSEYYTRGNPPRKLAAMNEKICVLVVEDEALILLDTIDQLEEAGFQVLCATDAAAAVGLLIVHPKIRAIFTDVNMPGGMDGLVLAFLVRDRWPLVKIIVTSGLRRIGASEIPSGGLFFDKPYDGGAVIKAIRDMVSN